MSAAVKSVPTTTHRRLTSVQQPRVSVSPRTRQSIRRTVETLAPTRPPLWLRAIIHLQRRSTPITLLLVASALPVYGWSVYTQRAWGEAYEKLEQLQRQERQLVAANEIRKYEVTQQAELSPVGLVRQVPENTIFLKPEQLRQPDANQAKRSNRIVTSTNVPVSY